MQRFCTLLRLTTSISRKNKVGNKNVSKVEFTYRGTMRSSGVELDLAVHRATKVAKIKIVFFILCLSKPPDFN